MRDEAQREALVKRLGVFELRGLAREMGIPSPTTKRRDELVTLILDAFKTGVSADVNTQKRGRPYKKLTSLEEIVNSVVDFDRKPDFLSYDSIVSFAQESKPVVCMDDGKIEAFKGVARRSEDSLTVGALFSNAKIFVENVMYADKVQTGDIIEMTAKKLNEDSYLSISIDKINGTPSAIFERFAFPHGEQVISEGMLPYMNGEVKVGRRNVYMLEEDLYENYGLRNLLVACERQGYNPILLGANIAYENQLMLQKLNVQYNFTTPYDSDACLNLNKTIDGLNLAEKMLERGENVVVVVFDVVGLLLGIDGCFEKDEASEKYAQETIVVAKKLLALAKAYESGKSATVLLNYHEIDKDDKFLNSDILRISKRV